MDKTRKLALTIKDGPRRSFGQKLKRFLNISNSILLHMTLTIGLY